MTTAFRCSSRLSPTLISELILSLPFASCFKFIFHLVQGCGVSARFSCGLDRKQWGSLNILLGVLILKTQLLPLAAGCLVARKGRQGGEGSDGPDASEGRKPGSWWCPLRTGACSWFR